jgi:flagellar L-ring protein precursor FlgH
MKTLLISSVALVALLTGCAAPGPLPSDPNFGPAMPMPRAAEVAPTGGIFRAGAVDGMLSQNRRFQVGDVITVLLSESTQANRQQSTDLSREASNNVIPQGLTNRIAGASSLLNGVNLNNASIETSGTGSANQRASLNGSVSVTVVEVLPNGNLVLRGEKQMTLSEGTEVIQVSGIVRAEDIAPNNTVQSRRLADARFIYRGEGDIARTSAPGWGTRGLMRLWPF